MSIGLTACLNFCHHSFAEACIKCHIISAGANTRQHVLLHWTCKSSAFITIWQHDVLTFLYALSYTQTSSSLLHAFNAPSLTWNMWCCCSSLSMITLHCAEHCRSIAGTVANTTSCMPRQIVLASRCCPQSRQLQSWSKLAVWKSTWRLLLEMDLWPESSSQQMTVNANRVHRRDDTGASDSKSFNTAFVSDLDTTTCCRIWCGSWLHGVYNLFLQGFDVRCSLQISHSWYRQAIQLVTDIWGAAKFQWCHSLVVSRVLVSTI